MDTSTASPGTADRRGRGRPRKDPSQPKDTSKLLQALQNFDQLPNSAFVSEPVVRGLVGKSRVTVYIWQRKGLLPKSYKFGHSVVFNVGEVRAALAALTGKGGNDAAS